MQTTWPIRAHGLAPVHCGGDLDGQNVVVVFNHTRSDHLWLWVKKSTGLDGAVGSFCLSKVR